MTFRQPFEFAVLLAGLGVTQPVFPESPPVTPAPGAILTISGDLLNGAFAHTENKKTQVSITLREKYHVQGSARLTGQMSFQPVACDDHWRLQMKLSGTAAGCSTTQVRRLHVDTRNQSSVCVLQDVFVSPAGIRAGQTTVSAPTKSGFQSARSGRPPARAALAAQAARLQFRVLPGKGDRLATEVSELVLRQELERDLPEMMARANQQFREKMLGPLEDLAIPLGNVRLSSTNEAVQVHLSVPETSPSSVPALESADVGARIHQDVLNRLMRQLYGGSTQVGQDVETQITEALSALGATEKAEPAKQPWSISFDKQRPLVFQLEKNSVRVTMRGDGFTFGGKDYPAMTASVVYDVKHDGHGWRALRRLVEILPVDGVTRPLTARENVVKGLLFLRVGQMFAREIDFSRLKLPQALGHTGQGAVTRFETKNGWLVLEWQRSP